MTFEKPFILSWSYWYIMVYNIDMKVILNDNVLKLSTLNYLPYPTLGF